MAEKIRFSVRFPLIGRILPESLMQPYPRIDSFSPFFRNFSVLVIPLAKNHGSDCLLACNEYPFNFKSDFYPRVFCDYSISPGSPVFCYHFFPRLFTMATSHHLSTGNRISYTVVSPTATTRRIANKNSTHGNAFTSFKSKQAQ